MSTKLVERIGALLAKAESTDSPAEAEALIAKAQELATTHAVDLALARRRQVRRGKPPEPVQRRVEVAPGARSGRRHLVTLFVAVAHANDVVVDVASDSSFVLAFGFATDLDVVETLWASLATQMAEAAAAAIRAGVHREEVYRSPRTGQWRSDARVFRTSFNLAYVRRIAARLTEAREAALAATAPAPGGEGSTGALVLADAGAQVRRFHASASAARGTWRGNRVGITARSPAGEQAGDDAGRRARLGAPTALPSPRRRLHR